MRQLARMACVVAVLVAAAPHQVQAASGDLAPVGDWKYDLNNDGKLSAAELAVKALHESKGTGPLYEAIDVGPVDGVFEPNELAAFYAKSRKTSAKTLAPLLQQVGKPVGNGVDLVALYDAEKALRCASGQGIYIRQDRFDIGPYINSIPASGAQGAAFSITRDISGNATTASIHGVVDAVLYRSPCLTPPSGDTNRPYVSGFVFAPWVYANGTLKSSGKQPPTNLQFGFDTEFEVAGTKTFDLQYWTFEPYFQTDFQGAANIWGGKATWTPYRMDWRLNAATVNDRPVDYFWKFNLFADYRHVAEAGNSGLAANANYAWLGADLGIAAHLFPKQFGHTLTFSAGYDAGWDAVAGVFAGQLTSSLAWAFNPSSSISLNYTRGTDRQTMTDSDTVTVALRYKN